MTGEKFAKYCGDCALLGSSHCSITDVDLAFFKARRPPSAQRRNDVGCRRAGDSSRARAPSLLTAGAARRAQVKAKGARRITFDQFLRALNLVAEKRGTTLCELVAAAVKHVAPINHAAAHHTIRLHDDRSTYTGARCLVRPGAAMQYDGPPTSAAALCVHRCALAELARRAVRGQLHLCAACAGVYSRGGPVSYDGTKDLSQIVNRKAADARGVALPRRRSSGGGAGLKPTPRTPDSGSRSYRLPVSPAPSQGAKGPFSAVSDTASLTGSLTPPLGRRRRSAVPSPPVSGNLQGWDRMGARPSRLHEPPMTRWSASLIRPGRLVLCTDATHLQRRRGHAQSRCSASSSRSLSSARATWTRPRARATSRWTPRASTS